MDVTAEKLTLATARLVLRMQTSTLAQLLTGTDLLRADVEAELAATIEAAGVAWTEAGQAAAQHLLLVLRTSQRHTIEEVMARPDVRQALTLPFEQAAGTTKDLIRTAWDNGVLVGDQHAEIALNTIGKVPGEWVVPDQMYLDVLGQDVDSNVAEAAGRIEEAVTQHPEAVAQNVQKVLNDLSRRSRLSVQAAGWRGANQGVEDTLKAAGIEDVMWITKFSAATCLRCAKMHGLVVPIGDDFPIGGMLHGGIGKPPVHPNCRCTLVPIIPEMVDEPGPSVETMQAWAKEWIGEHF